MKVLTRVDKPPQLPEPAIQVLLNILIKTTKQVPEKIDAEAWG